MWENNLAIILTYEFSHLLSHKELWSLSPLNYLLMLNLQI